MEILLILILSGFIAREVGRDVVDAIAVGKGKDAPSVERDKVKAAREATSTKKWKASHGGAAAEPGIGAYFGRILSNSVEAWADSSTKRHRRRQLLDAETAETKDSAWLEAKLRRTDKRAARAQKVAGWFRGVWETLADRAYDEAYREKDRLDAEAEDRRREDATVAWAARERRAAEDAAAAAAAGKPSPADKPAADAESATGEPGTESPPPRTEEKRKSARPEDHGDPDPLRSGTTSGEYEPYWVGPDSPSNRDRQADPPPPEPPKSTGPVKATAERLDAEGNPVEDTPTGPLLLPPPPLQLEAAPAATNPAGTPAVSPTATTTEEFNMSAGAEITSLSAAKAYTERMKGYLDELAGLSETYQAELTQLGKDIADEISDAELAASSLASVGLGSSEAVKQLQIANEQLGLMKGATESAAGAVAPMKDQVASTQGAYDVAMQAFNAADGVAEQAQAQKAQGNLADNTDFYTNV